VKDEKLKYNKLSGSFWEGKRLRPRLKANLTEQEEKMLFELRKSTAVSQRVKDRAQVIRLSHEGWFVEKIAAFFGWNIQTVRETLHRWSRKGLEGLHDAPGRGKQARWNESDMEFLERCLEEPRSYNRKQLAKKLADERGVHLSPGHLRDVLKKRGSCGNERANLSAPIKTL
jgi:transposase